MSEIPVEVRRLLDVAIDSCHMRRMATSNPAITEVVGEAEWLLREIAAGRHPDVVLVCRSRHRE